MARPPWEVANIVQRYGETFRAQHPLPAEQLRLLRALELCRSAPLGGHIEQCGHCDHQRITYNSCRNRHCPKCQSLARSEWIERRKAELLPIGYFHVVFTVPQQLNSLALQNKEVFYNLLLTLAASTLQTIANDPIHLGAEIGLFAILHTWGQTLTHHPHVHCVVTGGGLRPGRDGWRSSAKRFFVSVRVLGKLFRGLFLSALQKAFDTNQLSFHGALAPFAQPKVFRALLAPLYKRRWLVYAKPPFGGPEQVVTYLGRYTHSVAISNHRLRSIGNGQVTFQYKQYRSSQPHLHREMTVSADEFLRRFLLHTLPPGFQRIRHYGLLASRSKVKNLALCREFLSTAPSPPARPDQPARNEIKERLLQPLLVCPKCRLGTMVRIRFLPSPTGPPRGVNTS